MDIFIFLKTILITIQEYKCILSIIIGRPPIEKVAWKKIWNGTPYNKLQSCILCIEFDRTMLELFTTGTQQDKKRASKTEHNEQQRH